MVQNLQEAYKSVIKEEMNHTCQLFENFMEKKV